MVQTLKHVCCKLVDPQKFFFGGGDFVCNCEGRFHLYSLSAVHSYDLYHIHMSFSSYNGSKLNLHLTCFQRGFIAQTVEHRTGIAEAMDSNPVGVSEYFRYFITARSFSLLFFIRSALI